MNCLINFLVIVFFILHDSIGQEQCTDYYNKPGVCVPLESCPSLKELNKVQSFSNRMIIAGSRCLGTSDEVCCETEVKDRAPFGVIVTSRPVPVPVTEIVTTSTTRRPVVTERPSSSGVLPIPGTNVCGTQYPSRVVGGSVTSLDEHPWLARLEYTFFNGTRAFLCAGALINSRYVLTAAHCIPTSYDQSSLTSIRLGEWNTATERDCFGVTCADPVQDITVDEIVVHPDFVSLHADDIALIRLSAPATFSNFVQPLCLPSIPELRSITDYHDKPFELSGWGATEQMSSSNLKLRVALTGVSTETCKWIWRENQNTITNKQICAGGRAGEGSCRGDSGGPLMSIHKDSNGDSYFYAVGIVSYGTQNCAMQNWPGVYTNVASYMDWIEATVKP